MKIIKKKFETNIKTTYDLNKLMYYEHVKLLPCTLQMDVEETITFTFDINDKRVLLEIDNLSNKDKFMILLSCIELVDIYNVFQFSLSPSNLYVDFHWNVYVLERDILDYTTDRELLFVDELKYFIGSLFTKYSYQDFVDGGLSVLKGNRMLEPIVLMTLPEITTWIHEELNHILKKEKSLTSISIKLKKRWKLLTGLTVVMNVALLTICTVLYFNVVQIDQRRLLSVGYFFDSNYPNVITSLGNVTTSKLMSDELYILSLSFIRTSGFQQAAMEVASSQIVHKSNEEYQRFWVHLGRNEFIEAYEIADAFLDRRLLYFAYSVELKHLEVESDLSLSEKESRSKELTEKINSYLVEIEELYE